MNWIVEKIKGDLVIWVIVVLLSLVSLLAIYSSTKSLAYVAKGGNTEYYVLKHFLLMIAGFFIMYFAHKIDYKYYAGISKVLLPLSVVLLIVTYLFGEEKNNAVRWLELPGTGISFQTSDMAKMALIMYLSRAIALKQEVITDFKKGFLPLIIPILLICGLIAPADLSSAGLLFIVSIILLFIGRAKLQHLGYVLGAGIAMLFLAITLSLALGQKGRIDTWKSRIESFFTDDKGHYQNQQAKIAIAKGGFIGKGPGNSVQRNFLPNPYADFIFAIIIEEYGLVGAIFILSLYLLLFQRCLRILLKSPNSFGALLAIGLTLSLVMQGFINMGVAVHLFPLTGLPLPLISMGGTALWFTCFAIGVVLSVSARIEKQTENNKSLASA